MEEYTNRSDIEKSIIKSNRISANILSAHAFLVMNIPGIVAFLLDRFLYQNNDFPIPVFAVITVLALALPYLAISRKGEGKNHRYLLICGMLLYAFGMVLFTPKLYWFVIFFPVLCTIRYCYPSFSLLTGIFSMLMMGAALFIQKADLNQILSVMLPLLVVCVFSYLIADAGLRMIRNTAKVVEDRNEAEKAAHDMKTNIMISQIQPHFLYNTLMAITGIEGNPPETMDAIADFGQYLRENLHILQTRDAIPFEDEIRHVQLYVSLEKLRFENELQVEMDLQETDFGIPPLTVQMLVENAIKHGVSKKTGGGTVKVKTFIEGDNYVITVEDNGVGFNAQDWDKLSTEHIGLRSVRDRLKEMVNGEMKVESRPNVGTWITLYIPTSNPKPEKATKVRA